ncbi:hypothetical protein [Streptomyces sp. NPDC017991]|uniref:hypothetical protein n=1 Tax=Streptomyces sp. NPDC017991 TaxID=3365026 RepID=UPI0037AF6C2D
MQKKLAVLAGAAALLAASIATAPGAQASDEENLLSMEVCKRPSVSKFKMHLWYNSGQGGSYRNIGYSVYDFNALRVGGSDPSSQPINFCIIAGASGYWPGSGLRIKNNAASGQNDHYKYTAEVCFNSGYKGVRDKMAPYQHIDRFRYVYNDNASFRWV